MFAQWQNVQIWVWLSIVELFVLRCVILILVSTFFSILLSLNCRSIAVSLILSIFVFVSDLVLTLTPTYPLSHFLISGDLRQQVQCCMYITSTRKDGEYFLKISPVYDGLWLSAVLQEQWPEKPKPCVQRRCVQFPHIFWILLIRLDVFRQCCAVRSLGIIYYTLRSSFYPQFVSLAHR